MRHSPIFYWNDFCGARSPGATANVDSSGRCKNSHQAYEGCWGCNSQGYNQIRREQRQQVLAVAAEEEIMVVPEGARC